MKALLVEKWQPFENLKVKEHPIPKPKKHEYLIKIRAAGLSFATNLVVQGKYQVKPPLPFIPGTEIAGEIASTDSDQKQFFQGQRVCAVVDYGGLAEYACAHVTNIFPIPDELSYEKAITFTNTYATSLAALSWSHLLNLRKNQTLLVHGATGGVGSAAIEIAKAQKARVIAAVSNPKKMKAAEEFGADQVILNKPAFFKKKIMTLTKNEGVDAVFDPIGGDVFTESIRCLKPEGRIIPIGFASGRIPSIPTNLLLVKNITACGLNMGLYFGWGPVDDREKYKPTMDRLMNQLFELYLNGKINPKVSNTFKLSEASDAMNLILDQKTIGRISIKFE